MIILFLNHKIQSCGVYQYGLRLFNILNKSNAHRYVYKELDSYDEYTNILNKFNPNVIIYNYHRATMSWLNQNNIKKNVKNIGIPHETNEVMFDIILSINPDEPETNTIFNIPRPIYENIDEIFSEYKITNKNIEEFINYNEGPEIPIFGSFGFGFVNKGFHKIISLINDQYDSAIIKLIITFAAFDPNKISNIKNILELCNSIVRKPNIKLLISHHFFTNEEILLFLSSNTCNIFLYDTMEGRGISSTIDYAISVNKPFIISDSYMFRNVYSDEICVYKTNIKTAIENSKKILPTLLTKYSNNNLINKVDTIINNKCAKFKLLYYEVSAYYHITNYNETANVTDKCFDLFNSYKNQNITTFKVLNDTFWDTCNGCVKTLFINLKKNNSVITISYIEGSIVSWSDIITKINNKVSNTIEVSIGEIIDKYSILELKNKYIKDAFKLAEIQKEMNTLEKYVITVKNTYFYKILLYINELIWIDTDIIKSLINNSNDYETVYKYAKISEQIFQNNQKRFRLKKYFNILENSNISECKSYKDTICFITIHEETQIYNKIPEINYLCIGYDYIYFDIKYKNIINQLFNNPNIHFIIKDDTDILINYDISAYNIDNKIKDVFDFEPIIYKSGGKLGDFINQLSVICENYYKTGRKGLLYIFDIDSENFLFGLNNTYNDIYQDISSQKFIKDFKIYNNEKFDIDLSAWRLHLGNNNCFTKNWYLIYNTKYDVEWGKHRWLSSTIDVRWDDKIIINITPYRFMSPSCLAKLFELIKDNVDNCIFVSNEIEHYNYFCEKTELNVAYYTPKNFTEIVTIINSCKIGYFGFSSMAVIANALHKNHYMIGVPNVDFEYNNIKDIIPHVLDIFI